MKLVSEFLTEATNWKRCNNCDTAVPDSKRVCPDKKCRSKYFTPESEEQADARAKHNKDVQDTFDSLTKITEAEHYLGDSYGKWGIVTDKHKTIMGHSHPTAITHEELGYPDYKVEFAQDLDEDHLSVRTRGPKSLELAIKHFATLPHMRSGKVTHTHYGRIGMTEFSGKSHEVLARMKELAQK